MKPQIKLAQCRHVTDTNNCGNCTHDISDCWDEAPVIARFNEGGRVETNLETKLRDIYALMSEAAALRAGGWQQAEKKEFDARRLMDALIDEVKAK